MEALSEIHCHPALPWRERKTASFLVSSSKLSKLSTIASPGGTAKMLVKPASNKGGGVYLPSLRRLATTEACTEASPGPDHRAGEKHT